ncbi:hypothetical protein GTCCBUS3UF5_7610 [Geobacillus thermoleovorans CCB_US3_UF5]|uniref:Uncharacterized protein n=2 Tax=Geobacillus TaxID=129337 RepID=A0A1Q5T7H6_9BACL|nr:hypothetical protein GTCCBUS3UF5_7610 [Geobacillus thermoleovorans CCB_US3_UF5]OKO96194.1 hypothetical protein BRO54_0611 [Geobacillus proteiniphilus]
MRPPPSIISQEPVQLNGLSIYRSASEKARSLRGGMKASRFLHIIE